MKFREEIKESPTLAFAEAARLRQSKGLPIYSLGLGEPDFATPPSIVKAVSSVLAKGNSTYSSPLGLPKLKEKIAEKLVLDNQVPAKASNVIVTAGAKQALSTVLMALLQPGDEVVVLSPAFVSFIPQVYLAEPDCIVKIVDVNKADFSLPIQKLKDAISTKTKAIIINTPNNPAGFMLGESDLKELYELAFDAGAYIITDEVYEKLVYGTAKHISIGSFEQSVERVITINGFSKSHAMTGWRLGYATLPESVAGIAAKIQQHMYTNTCTFIQAAVLEAWDVRCLHLSEYNLKLKARSEQLREWSKSVEGVTCQVPEAGFFMMLNISELNMTSNEFCASLLTSTGVATTPGLAFGKQWDDHVRVSFALEQSQLDDAMTLIADFIKEL